MPIVDTAALPVTERLPGWWGRYYHSATMTVAHYEFAAGAAIHEHRHPQEEIYEVLEGELEIVIAGERHRLQPGTAAIVPGGAAHTVRALTRGRALIVDSPARREFA